MLRSSLHCKMWGTIFLFIGSSILCQNGVRGHGRLIEPPSRSSMWRYGFNTTANYNDHELYCGGFSRQYQRNNGNCGVCGDAWDMPQPRPNEAGGVYGHGIIVRKYRVNSIIRIKIELTANHRGYFEFRLCPNNNPKKIVSQKCLDNYILKQSNGDERYFPGEGSKVFESRYLLPKSLTCTQCVIQWRYIAGNNWGPCSNGTQGVGCGPQEEFRACADVAITDRSGHASSAEEDDTEDNNVDTNKLEGENGTTPIDDEKPEDAKDPVVWPFIMALLALVVAALAFGALFGWFYRKEMIQFARDTVSHSNNWKMTLGGGMNNNIMTQTSGSHLPQEQYVANANNRPIPPPRNKKATSQNEDYHNLQNQRRHGPITPDIISHPMQVTINGLAI